MALSPFFIRWVGAKTAFLEGNLKGNMHEIGGNENA